MPSPPFEWIELPLIASPVTPAAAPTPLPALPAIKLAGGIPAMVMVVAVPIGAWIAGALVDRLLNRLVGKA